MPLGPAIRRMFGRYENDISELYRSIYINLDTFVGQIQKWVPATNILELGCGEGAVTGRLVKSYPKAFTTGIDITPKVGRLFQGDRNRVRFKQQSIQDFSRENAENFDLLIACDIMHHIPWELHNEILTYAKKTIKPGGYFVLKDWERNKSLIHFLCYLTDRFITGDQVRYKSAHELRELIIDVFGPTSIKDEKRIRPQWNNIAFLIQV